MRLVSLSPFSLSLPPPRLSSSSSSPFFPSFRWPQGRAPNVIHNKGRKRNPSSSFNLFLSRSQLAKRAKKKISLLFLSPSLSSSLPSPLLSQSSRHPRLRYPSTSSPPDEEPGAVAAERGARSASTSASSTASSDEQEPGQVNNPFPFSTRVARTPSANASETARRATG